VASLGGATHPVVTDRIELGTYMLVPAICGGEVELLGGRIDLVAAFCEKLDQAGISVSQTPRGLKVARRNGRIRSLSPSGVVTRRRLSACRTHGFRALYPVITM
jgi:UDP-N-acetylglucosamine 1-carboxyvinyltransferase